MIKYYDREHNRLVFIERKADAGYWDGLWDSDDLKREIVTPRNRFVVKTTNRYLKRGARILEGGSGRGDKVYALRKHGYDAFGVDNAEKTVRQINDVMPDLKVVVGDIRDLQFDDGFFDGYWSLGVIEHFYHGYEAVMQEMHRVIRGDGFLFLVAPTMSWIRSFKAKRGMYPEYMESPELIEGFFQFALDPRGVIDNFERGGFRLIKHWFPNDVEGLKDEVSYIHGPLQILYDSRILPAKVLRISIGSVTRLFAGNASCYVFRRS